MTKKAGRYFRQTGTTRTTWKYFDDSGERDMLAAIGALVIIVGIGLAIWYSQRQHLEQGEGDAEDHNGD